MPLHVYRSLDRSSTVFGIRGSFFFVLLVMALAWLLVGVIVGLATALIVGLIVFIVGTAASYGATLLLQSKLSEKDLKRFLAGRRSPEYLIYYPVESLLQGQDDADTQKGEGSS